MIRVRFALPVCLGLIGLTTACDKNRELQPASAAGQVVVEVPAKLTPNDGIEVPLTFLDAHRYNVAAGKQQFTFKDGLFTMTSREKSDSHYVSAPVDLVAGHTYRLTAQMKGTALDTSKAPYAGGIGVYRTKMVIDAPAGTYDWKVVSGEFIAKTSGPTSITVGLGGWKTASGTLEVKDLKLFR